MFGHDHELTVDLSEIRVTYDLLSGFAHHEVLINGCMVLRLMDLMNCFAVHLFLDLGRVQEPELLGNLLLLPVQALPVLTLSCILSLLLYLPLLVYLI